MGRETFGSGWRIRPQRRSEELLEDRVENLSTEALVRSSQCLTSSTEQPLRTQRLDQG